MADFSDGAIVGSAIIKLLEQYGKDAPKYIGEYVKKMKSALNLTKKAASNLPDNTFPILFPLSYFTGKV